ncbi:hypothetical protein II906_10885, partial [bacterium]|nr:hypothetical protein [bacterium]
MEINNRFIKNLFKTILIIVVIEVLYLTAVPFTVTQIAKTNLIKKVFSSQTNADLKYKKLKFKTHVTPSITIKAKELGIYDKENNSEFIFLKKPEIKLSLLSLIAKKIDIRSFNSDITRINVSRDKDGNFNFEELFNLNSKSEYIPVFKNNKINTELLNINYADEQLNSDISINSTPVKLRIGSKGKKIYFVFKGDINSNNKKISEFDVDLMFKYPFDKDLSKDTIEGKLVLYGIHLDTFKPFIEKYIDTKMTKLSGDIDFVNLTSQKEQKVTNIVLNTSFKNLVYDREDWKNYVIAKGQNDVNAKIFLEGNTISISSFKYGANNVKFNALGDVIIDKNLELHLKCFLKESRAENILPILPPIIPPDLRMVEKAKMYEAYGDVWGDIFVDGKFSLKDKKIRPDVTGFVKARNVHVLDKATREKHLGTIDLKFNKRTMDMNILVNTFESQHAIIKGYVYLFREGLNHITVETTKSVDLLLTQKILLPISRIFNFQLGPVADMEIKQGKGNIVLDIVSSMEMVNLNGTLNLDKVHMGYNGLFGEVKHGKARVDFSGDEISFKTERAYIKNNFASLEGKVKINSDLDLTISAPNAEAADMLEIINNSSLLKD